MVFLIGYVLWRFCIGGCVRVDMFRFLRGLNILVFYILRAYSVEYSVQKYKKNGAMLAYM